MQVNLYTYLPKPKKLLLSVKHQVAIIVGFMLLLAMLVFSLQWESYKSQQVIEQLQQQHREISDKVVSLELQLPGLIRHSDVNQSLKALQQRLQRRAKIQKDLHLTVGANMQGFSSYLTDFSHHHVEGVWLRSIQIYGASNDVSLEGSAKETNLITTYLGYLQASSRFDSKRFKILRVLQSKQKENYVDFTTQTQAKETASSNTEEVS